MNKGERKELEQPYIPTEERLQHLNAIALKETNAITGLHYNGTTDEIKEAIKRVRSSSCQQ